MPKQQSLYHPAGGYPVIYLPGNKRAWAGPKYTSAFPFTGIPGRSVFLCLSLFTASLFAGFPSVHKGALMHEQEVICMHPTTDAAQQNPLFSFEYAGLFHLKVVIHSASDNDAFLISAIDITTSTQPSSDHSFKNCNRTYVSGKR
jgi:hypothetical protein